MIVRLDFELLGRGTGLWVRESFFAVDAFVVLELSTDALSENDLSDLTSMSRSTYFLCTGISFVVGNDGDSFIEIALKEL
jgi:hypothetical protein